MVAFSIEELARTLAREGAVDEWIARSKEVQRSERLFGEQGKSTGRPVERRIDEYRLSATVYRDQQSARGEASSAIASRDASMAKEMVRAAAARASDTRGPAWSLPTPAAPARVEVADATATADIESTADAIVDRLSRALSPGERIIDASIRAESRTTSIRTSTSFASSYPESSFRVSLALQVGEHGTEIVELSARRARDLALGEAFAEARARSELRGRAQPLSEASYDLVFSGRALATGAGTGAEYGLFAPFIAQADATGVRRGRSLYRPSQSIYRSKPAGDALSLSSDGTIPFAELSRPFGDGGEPTRKFEIVRAGTAVGLALDHREAALGNVNANGGVRNLVVAGGSSTWEELLTPTSKRPVLEVIELGGLAVDGASGSFSATIGLGVVHSGGASVPTIGGNLVGNTFDLFSRARFSSELAAIGWYHGPGRARFDDHRVS